MNIEKFNKLLEKVNENDVVAMHEVACVYLEGKIIKKDIAKAMELLIISAKTNDEAQYTLANIYLDGKFVKKDKSKAIKYFELSAKTNVKAQEKLRKINKKTISNYVSLIGLVGVVLIAVFLMFTLQNEDISINIKNFNNNNKSEVLLDIDYSVNYTFELESNNDYKGEFLFEIKNSNNNVLMLKENNLLKYDSEVEVGNQITYYYKYSIDLKKNTPYSIEIELDFESLVIGSSSISFTFTDVANYELTGSKSGSYNSVEVKSVIDIRG